MQTISIDQPADRLIATLRQRIQQPSGGVIVDLAQAGPLDSTRLAALYGAVRDAERRGVALRIEGGRPEAWEQLRTLGIDAAFATTAIPA